MGREGRGWEGREGRGGGGGGGEETEKKQFNVCTYIVNYVERENKLL